MNAPDGRRPLASRDAPWARSLARRLAATRVTPNAISMASVGCASLAAVALVLAGRSDGATRVALWLVVAFGCQARLLCNLLDGLVAIEGGKRTADGPVWNELPDRVSDVLILVAAGFAIASPALGWAAAAAALWTAYVRELGHGIDGVSDFSGPLAKPQRMALVSAAALLSTLEGAWDGHGQVLAVALWAIALGACATGVRRALALLRRRRAV